MPEKMMTLQELSDYLQISDKKIIKLVDSKVISAYKLGGELLRFRKDQIDAIRSEIDSRITEDDRIDVNVEQKSVREKLKPSGRNPAGNDMNDAIADFLYFNDFYIASAVIICVLLLVIFRG